MVRIVHVMPGRLRLRCEALRTQPALANKLCSLLEDTPGSARVEINSRTGGVLLHYQRCALRSPKFLDAFSAVMGTLFPAHFAPGRLCIRVDLLQGMPKLARGIEQILSPVPGIQRIAIDPSTGSRLLV